jgi:hypothetical protein
VLLKDGDELWRWSEDGARKIYSHVVRRALPTAQSHVTACFFGGGHCVRAARGRPVRLLCALHREAVRVGHSVRCKDGMSSLAGPAWVWLGCGERAAGLRLRLRLRLRLSKLAVRVHSAVAWALRIGRAHRTRSCRLQRVAM